MQATKRFGGIVPPLVTPLTPDERLDEPGLRRLIEYVLAGGVHGVVVLGSSGEAALLPPEVRRRTVEVAVQAVGGRVPVVVGTGEPGTVQAAETTREARQAGADAALVVPPYYFVHDQEAVKRHYRRVREAGQLPVMVYHIPGLTKVPIPAEAVRELAREGTVLGVKDSGGDFGYYQRVVDGTREASGFVALQGSDQLIFASLAYGGDGAISVRAQLTPAVVVALYDAARAGDWARARSLQRLMGRLGPAVGSGWHPAIKGALSALGICGPDVAAPGVRWSDAELAAQRTRLEEARREGLFDPASAV